MMRRKKYKYKKAFQIKKKKSILKKRFFWFSVLILMFLGTVLYFAFFSSFFQIKEIRISGNQRVLSQDIKAIIREQAENKKIIFFNSQSIFLFTFKETRRKLLEKFPQIDEVKIKRKLPDIIEVKIKEKTPIGIWCLGERCFYLDKKGVIFEEAGSKEKLIINSQAEGLEVFLGEKVLEADYIEAILAIQRSLIRQINIEANEFIISPDKKKLIVRTSGGWEARFSLEDNISDQLSNLILVLKEKIPPEMRKNLDYINLMFGNRVYFKYKESQ